MLLNRLIGFNFKELPFFEKLQDINDASTLQLYPQLKHCLSGILKYFCTACYKNMVKIL